MAERTAEIQRRTAETRVQVNLSLDPTEEGGYRHETGVGFFDHMLDHLAHHGRLGLRIEAEGDCHVDDHHTVEDVGIVLGQALDQALGDRKGIERYGFASVPMDEALARVTVDLSGRPALVCDIPFASTRIGTFETQIVREFLQALANHARLACHVEMVRGENDHHKVEAVFKALGRALREAVRRTGGQVPSTKGSL